jgi:hypothetical protein
VTQRDEGNATRSDAEHLHAQGVLIPGNCGETHRELWTRDPRSVQADTAASLLVPLFVGSSAAGQGFRGVRASSRLQAPVTFVDQRILQAPGPRDGLPRRMPIPSV